MSETPAEMSDDAKALALMGTLVTASMDANFKTMDRLYEDERERRQAWEVLVSDTLIRLDTAWGGTVREYEQALRPLRNGIYGRSEELAARHPEHDTH